MYYCKQLSMITKHDSRPVTLQSSCNYENDLAYTLDISLAEVRKPRFIYFFFIQSRAVG